MRDKMFQGSRPPTVRTFNLFTSSQSLDLINFINFSVCGFLTEDLRSVQDYDKD